MFKFLKNKTNKKDQNSNLILKTASLLIHAANIDENYTQLKSLYWNTLEVFSTKLIKSSFQSTIMDNKKHIIIEPSAGNGAFLESIKSLCEESITHCVIP